jgi:hypothetical protein
MSIVNRTSDLRVIALEINEDGEVSCVFRAMPITVPN